MSFIGRVRRRNDRADPSAPTPLLLMQKKRYNFAFDIASSSFGCIGDPLRAGEGRGGRRAFRSGWSRKAEKNNEKMLMADMEGSGRIKAPHGITNETDGDIPDTGPTTTPVDFQCSSHHSRMTSKDVASKKKQRDSVRPRGARLKPSTSQ